jgi:hypothetical protein
VDRLLRRLVHLVGLLGISSQELSERLALIRTEAVSGSAARTPHVSRTLKALHAGPAEIIQAWHRELRYQDEQGRPRPLSFQQGPRSFVDLVAASAPTLDANRALHDLLKAGAVSMEGKWITPLGLAYISPEAVRRAEIGLHAVENLLTTIETNLERPSPTGWFQREATCFRFERKQLARANRFVREQAHINLEAWDSWLQQYQLPPAAEDEGVTVVIGLYMAVRDSD